MAREKLNQLIAQGKTEEALSILLKVELKEEDVHKQIIMLSGQYHQWKRQDQLGLEPPKSDLRRIESALFDLIQTTEIPPLPEADPPPRKEPTTLLPTDPFADFKSLLKNSGIDWTKQSYGGDGSQRTQAMNLAQQPRVLLTSAGITADLKQKVYELEQTEFIKEVSIISRNNWVILRDRSRFWHGPGVAPDLGTKLWEFYNTGEEIKHLSLSPEGAFVLLRARSAFWASGDCPPELVTKLWEFYNAGEDIKQVALGPQGRFVILRGRNGFWHSGNLPQDLKDEIWRLNQGNHTIRRVYFCDADDWVILL